MNLGERIKGLGGVEERETTVRMYYMREELKKNYNGYVLLLQKHFSFQHTLLRIMNEK